MTHYEKQSMTELCAGMDVPAGIVQGIAAIVSEARKQAVVQVNSTLNMMYWRVGKYLTDELHYETYGQYGKSILQSIATQLTEMFGRGFTRTALVRMMNVAQVFTYEEMCATLSHTLTWSHLYITELPDKQWFIDKLNRLIIIAQENRMRENKTGGEYNKQK